jgi:hypothetical protein
VSPAEWKRIQSLRVSGVVVCLSIVMLSDEHEILIDSISAIDLPNHERPALFNRHIRLPFGKGESFSLNGMMQRDPRRSI